MTQRKLLWLRWVDPLASVYYSSAPTEPDAHLEAMHDSLYGPGDVKWEDPGMPNLPVGPVLYGAGGVIPLHESMLPGKLYNFWVGHTNFDLGADNLVGRLERTDGVETLDIITRYRFRVGIGRAFDQDEVKRAIEHVLCGPPAKQPTDVSRLQQALAARHPFWTILVMPSGHVEIFVGNSQEEVVGKSRDRVGLATRVIASWTN